MTDFVSTVAAANCRAPVLIKNLVLIETIEFSCDAACLFPERIAQANLKQKMFQEILLKPRASFIFIYIKEQRLSSESFLVFNARPGRIPGQGESCCLGILFACRSAMR